MTDKVLTLKRNYNKEGTLSKGEKQEWYTGSTLFYAIHIFGKENTWKYKIVSYATERTSNLTYESKQIALEKCYNRLLLLLQEEKIDLVFFET